MLNIEKRIKKEYEEMTIEEKYELLNYMEGKELGEQEGDANFMEGILNMMLEATTIFAKIFHII